jgi:uncharacterized protein YidB (DUF937 family)
VQDNRDRDQVMTPMQLRARYDAGATLKDLAAETGLNAETVRTRLLAAGTAMRSPYRRVRIPGLVAAYRRGDTLTMLAAQYGMSYSMVRRRLLEARVQLRPPGTTR